MNLQNELWIFFLTFLPDGFWPDALCSVKKRIEQLGEGKSLQRWSRLWKAVFPQSQLNEDELSKGCRVCWQYQEPNSSQKTNFPYSLSKRETQTSIIMGTSSGFWYPVALPCDQRFCVSFSHTHRARCTWIVLKNPKLKKPDNFQFTLSRQQEIRVKHHQDLVLRLQGLDYQFSLPLHPRHSWISFRVN